MRRLENAQCDAELRASTKAVEVRGLRICYGDTEVVRGVSFSVAQGEVVSLLGPSGCGKTTTLRAIAGFALPSYGDVYVDGVDVTSVPPNHRDIGMVFQGYALFPHLSVFDNVAYGLRMRRCPKAEMRERVQRALSLVRLTPFADRRPKQLSGGQQQRVAIARALVIEPKVLLLDEPLSNLDAKLRQEMRVELRRLLHSTNVASIFVTHDQEEAMVLSDRIILMNSGEVEQEGSPREIYQQPRSLFAATFVGAANFVRGQVVEVGSDGIASMNVEGVSVRGQACGELAAGMDATLVVKHEHVGLTGGGEEADNRVACRLATANFIGPSVQLHCRLGDQTMVALVAGRTRSAPEPELGADVHLVFHKGDALIFPGNARSS